MRLAYAFSKKQFGKVLSPLKMVSSRMPLPFLFWSGKIQRLEKHLALPKDLVLMLRLRTAQITGCTFCIDIAKSLAIKGFGRGAKFYGVANFESSALFSEREKAALRFATELTRDHRISDETYNGAARLFTERELTETAWVVASEHVYNFANIAFNIESDNLCRLPTQDTQTAGR